RAQRRGHRRTTTALRRFGGVGSLVVRTVLDGRPREGVLVSVDPSGPDEQRTTTDRDGSAAFALKPGSHSVVIVQPPGTVMTSPLVSTVAVKLLELMTLEAQYRRIAGAARLRAA